LIKEDEMRKETGAESSFGQELERRDLKLERGRTQTLQVNVGLLCDLACRHCHLSAGPGRREVMSRETMDEVIAYARRTPFQLADITGGAPEMVPEIGHLIAGLAGEVPKVMLRSNLTALAATERSDLVELCRKHKVALVTSFPAVSPAQFEAQRGDGVWEKSTAMLKRLNEMGYGVEGSGLELHLVANPSGAFLPQGQEAAERQFKRALARKLGVQFNNLYVFGNAPLGRFRQWLETSGNFESYMAKLVGAFNPCTVEGLMCRSMVSIAWDGTLYDCDFNQAADLPMHCRRIHVRDMDSPPEEGSPIAVGDHCYACTAGAGFT
jgi:radical SAM/Cys-rich protein